MKILTLQFNPCHNFPHKLRERDVYRKEQQTKVVGSSKDSVDHHCFQKRAKPQALFLRGAQLHLLRCKKKSQKYTEKVDKKIRAKIAQTEIERYTERESVCVRREREGERDSEF